MRKEAANYDKIATNIHDSGITTKQALFYRNHPTLATAKDIAFTSHKAGIDGAKCCAVIGGAISSVTNIIALCQDNKDLGEALKDIAIDTGKAAAVGYGTAFAGSAIKGLMQQSPSNATRALSKTGLPTMVVSITLEMGSAINRYAKGEIDGVQFLEEIGEKGSGMLASGLSATLGQIAIPIPVVGGLIGGMVGYTLNSMMYQNSLVAFKEAKLARKEYLRTKAMCEEARNQMEFYRIQFSLALDRYLVEARTELFDSLQVMDMAALSGEPDAFASAANAFAARMGNTLQFSTQIEFDGFMSADEPLRI